MYVSMRTFGLLLSICLAAACSSDNAFDGGDAFKADEVAAEDAPVLADSYGYVVTSSIIACSTRAGSDECKNDKRKDVTAVIRGLAAVSQQGARADLSIRGCRINLNWDGDSYDDTKYFNEKDTLQSLGELARIEGVFVEGVATPDTEAATDETSDDSPAEEEVSEEEAAKPRPVLASGLSALLIGAQLEKPVEEDMPTSKRDDRALDQDNDRKPGVSLEAPIGRVFLGARVIFNLPLTTADDGSLHGSLEAAGFDLSVYDDSIPFVDAEEKAEEALDKLKILSMEHTVTLVPGYGDCAQVLEDL